MSMPFVYVSLGSHGLHRATKAEPSHRKPYTMNKTILTDTAKANSETLTKIGHDSSAAAQELAKAYQELAAKNLKNLTAAVQALAAVKTPAHFFELQQKLLKDGVEAAMKDSQHIAKLTTAVFTAAFEPVKHQIEAVTKAAPVN